MSSPEPTRNTNTEGVPTSEDCLLVEVEALIKVIDAARGALGRGSPHTGEWNEALADAKLTVAAIRERRKLISRTDNQFVSANHWAKA